MSKLYTTLYDSEDPQQQLEYASLHQQRQDSESFVDALLSTSTNSSSQTNLPSWDDLYRLQQQQQLPGSPAFSTYSGSSSSSGSAHSSPDTGLIKMLDSDEADDLVDLFNITIEDLLSGNSLTFLNEASGADFALFTPWQQQQQQQQLMATASALQFDNTTEQQEFMQYQQQLQQYQQQQQRFQAMHSQATSGGPQRSNSLSPVMSCAPYPAAATQHYSHQHRHQNVSSSPSTPSSPSSRHVRFFPQSPENYSGSSAMMPPHSSAATTPAGSPSPSLSPAAPSTPHMSPTSSTFVTTAAAMSTTTSTGTTTPTSLPSHPSSPSSPSSAMLSVIPNTDGMTVIKNEDGSIMVYNPVTETMTFRCELCPEESFGRIHDLKRHQTSKHQEMTWPCEFCQRCFVRRDALLRHYTVKSSRDDGVHPASHETEKLLAARARAKLIC
ncbi:hypothetical protein BGZ99_002401 [Dissophora globulifera]|uniref:C2H2-type domain-containing protein n=1 Tax=Dissophora globulifera TaxID=979702 RepID=A0A9P6RSE9_9FUNG|nr:hypothetical protein BGZ99_002401 [Dissophora globulifera]